MVISGFIVTFSNILRKYLEFRLIAALHRLAEWRPSNNIACCRCSGGEIPTCWHAASCCPACNHCPTKQFYWLPVYRCCRLVDCAPVVVSEIQTVELLCTDAQLGINTSEITDCLTVTTDNNNYCLLNHNLTSISSSPPKPVKSYRRASFVIKCLQFDIPSNLLFIIFHFISV